MTVVMVQCRMSSSRLPGKALMELDGIPVLAWTLRAMKKVPADAYWLACDYDSEEELGPVAAACGWNVFAGPKDDVLLRYCSLIEKTGADVVIRGTADNPFLFYEAASEMVSEFTEKYAEYDYMTYTGLPHGSGVEVFRGKSLLKAMELTGSPYDHEHVGPALYRHPESFKSLFKPACERFCHPDLRSTIDVFSDFKRAEAVVEYVKAKRNENIVPSSGEKDIRVFSMEEPYDVALLVEALSVPYIKKQILFVPSTKKSRGTGHLRRCLKLARETGGLIYIEKDCSLEGVRCLVEEAYAEGLSPRQVINRIGEHDSYSLVVTDLFKMDEKEASLLSSKGPLASIDEGSSFHMCSDYLVDVIPSYGITRKANIASPAFIPMPGSRFRKNGAGKKTAINNVLVCIGGEDPAGLSESFAGALSGAGLNVHVIAGNPEMIHQNGKFTVSGNVKDLSEKLKDYDLVVTHYGFTAFEAAYCGTAVILASTTALHGKLAKKYGFACVSGKDVNPVFLKKAVKDKCVRYGRRKYSLYPDVSDELGKKDLALFLTDLSMAEKFPCPVCRDKKEPAGRSCADEVVARTPARTFRRCGSCSMIYISYSTDSNVRYEKSYFDAEYKKQYGRTYLDDFEAIKKQCLRRIENIKSISRDGDGTVPAILDIGCAYGPFLSAASDAGWKPYGSDISKAATDYVKGELGFDAVQASFADFDPVETFGIKNFDAVTMWYVIEHIRDLNHVLTAVNRLLRKGGTFSFSTPSGSGVSARLNGKTFFEQSPKDHYSIWEIENTENILKRFGFHVKKIVSTGHHPERIPFIKNKGIKPGSLIFNCGKLYSRIFKAGDTYEVYCVKTEDV